MSDHIARAQECYQNVTARTGNSTDSAHSIEYHQDHNLQSMPALFYLCAGLRSLLLLEEARCVRSPLKVVSTGALWLKPRGCLAIKAIIAATTHKEKSNTFPGLTGSSVVMQTEATYKQGVVGKRVKEGGALRETT